MGFQDVVFLPSRAGFSIAFKKIVEEVKASGSPHVLELLFDVSKGKLPVEYICSSKAFFVSRIVWGS